MANSDSDLDIFSDSDWQDDHIRSPAPLTPPGSSMPPSLLEENQNVSIENVSNFFHIFNN